MWPFWVYGSHGTSFRLAVSDRYTWCTSERNSVARESCCHVCFLLQSEGDARGQGDNLLTNPLAICPPTEHNSMFAFSSHNRGHGAELPTIRFRAHRSATPGNRTCARSHAGGGGRRHR